MRVFAICFGVFFSLLAKAQLAPDYFERDEKTLRVVFYNVENIFDPEDDPNKRDEEFTPEGDRYWNKYKFYEKLNRSAKAIMATGGWTPPEVVGICEIENRFVLEQLIYSTPLKNFDYAISHFESKDRRGIDVGLIYNKSLFQLVQESKIPVVFPWDTGYHTRDILWTTLKNGEDTLHFFVNHWPSRWSGQLETEPARIHTAKTLKAITDSMFSVNPKVKIIIMGDLNDGPHNKSMKEVLTGAYNNQVYLRNLMDDENLDWMGSHRYGVEWDYLDQMVLSRGILNPSKGWGYKNKSATACALGFLLEEDKKNLGLKPKRTFIGLSYHGGFSDHLPVKLDLIPHKASY